MNFTDILKAYLEVGILGLSRMSVSLSYLSKF